MGWIANIFIVVGMYRIGFKYRDAFLWSAFGESIWTVVSAIKGQYDLALICGLFVVMALINWYKWRFNVTSSS